MRGLVRFLRGMIRMPWGWQLWLLVLAVNALSLVIDATDVARWLRGERQETVDGL